MPKIVILDGYAMNPGDLSWDELKKLGDVAIYDRTPLSLVLERSAGAEILLTNKVVLNTGIIDSLSDLRYIGLTSTGCNVVDLQAASRRSIVVTNVPAYSTASVAQIVFAYILEFATESAITAMPCTPANGSTAPISASGSIRSPNWTGRR